MAWSNIKNEWDRIPKKLLFGWLPQTRPAHGAKLRWRDKVRQDLRDSPFQKVIGTAFVRIELHGEVCVKKDCRGYRMLVPTLHSLCVKLVTENSGEVRTLLGTSVRQLGHGGRNASHSLVHYWWGASSFGWLYFNGQWCVCILCALVRLSCVGTLGQNLYL